MSDSYAGASVTTSKPQASLDLAALVNLLHKAIPVPATTSEPSSLPPEQRPLFYYDTSKRRLKICTSGVLLRLYRLPEFKKQGSEFIQNLQQPSPGTEIRIGGQLKAGNEEKLTLAVDHLEDTIIEELNQALPDQVTCGDFLINQVEQELREIVQREKKENDIKNRSNNIKFPAPLQGQANLIPLTFEDRSQSQKSSDLVAKIISAVERIDSGNYFQRMCDGIVYELETNQDKDEDEIDEAKAVLLAEYERNDSQIQRFLKFLDEEALSRVRLKISHQIMKAIGERATANSDPEKQILAEYIQRIQYFIQWVQDQGLKLNMTAEYGVTAEIDFQDYIHNTRFFYALTVWPEWKTQIFENRQVDSEGKDTQITREISYRFRVNGQNPERGKPAFLARLDKLEEDFSETQKPYKIKNILAELFFISFVIPTVPEKSIPNENEGKTEANQEQKLEEKLKKELEKLCQKFSTLTRAEMPKLFQELQNRHSAMAQIARGLINIIKSKQIISQVSPQPALREFIVITRKIVNWDRLENASPGASNLLISSPSSPKLDKIAWLNCLEITDNPSTIPDLLFCIQVETELLEKNLRTQPPQSPLQLERLFPEKLLSFTWVPYEYKKEVPAPDNSKQHDPKQSQKDPYHPCEDAKLAVNLVFSRSIIIEYETRTLQKNHQKNNDQASQFHAAGVTAFATLAYSCIWSIIQQIKGAGNPEFSISLLRLQQKQEKDDKSGEQYVYAASQAIESLLAQENPTRMQGLIVKNLKSSNKQYVKQGVFNALFSLFPIAISTPIKPTLSKLGLISYKARPCDENPQSFQKNHLILSQSYIAHRIEQPWSGYQLQVKRMQSDIVSSEEELRKQRLIQEEIAYLQQQGCQHIVLLSHNYGSRRINKTADYNTPLSDPKFLETLCQNFPDLLVYPLTRDVFPGTRIRNRNQSAEAGFEILKASDHTHFFDRLSEIGLRDIIPVYTFATLHAIEQGKKPQSGFCVYFLLSDTRLTQINWTERSRQHFINPEGNSPIHPLLLTLLRGLHFIEAEKGIQKGKYMPVLDPFSWISPTTIEAAGEVKIFHSRRQVGKVLLSYPAVLTRIAQVLHRRKRS